MKRTKRGISLIVLIITIIVIIILATAILVSVINNNPISEANKARYESDRDNMQAVFTNTVGKIMAENQGVVNVTAGQINTVTKDAKEATGEVAYTVDNAMVAENASGTIKFDKGTNDATTYYTGKKLPIYAAGETKWYVDSEGVLSLEVAGVKYGTGVVGSGSTVTYTSLDNWQHQLLDGTVEEHIDEDVNGVCDKCVETKIPGLYNINEEFISFEDYLNIQYEMCCASCSNYTKHNFVEIEDDIITGRDICNTCGAGSLSLFILGREHDSMVGHLVLNEEIKSISRSWIFVNKLTEVTYYGTIEEWESYQITDAPYRHDPITVHCTDGDTIWYKHTAY